MELILSCRCLPCRGSGVYCRILNEKTDDWSEIFRTEEHQNARDPDWNSTLILNPSENFLRFEIISKNFLICVAEAELSELMARRSNYVWLDPCGVLLVHVVPVSLDPSLIHLSFAGYNLNTRFSKLYIKIYRHIENEKFIEVFKTSLVSCRKPIWNEFSLKVQDICNSDPEKPIRIAVYSTNFFRRNVFLGEVCLCLNELMESGCSYEMESGGRIEIFTELEQKFYFEEFIASGHKLSLINAIDFSKSNKDQNCIESFHYSSLEDITAYQKCFLDIHTCLSWKWPIEKLGALGFGGEWKEDKDCFTLTENDNSPWVLDIQTLNKAYEDSLKYIRFSGPTNLHFIIRKIIQIAQEAVERNKNEYFALCVLSDGDFSDFPEIQETLQEVPDLPISVIVFGVGISRCGALEYLDNQARKRKCFKFIPIYKYFIADFIIDQVEEQFMSYVHFKGIRPKQISKQEEIYF